MTTLESLAARLQTLEDERAIVQTLHQYGHAMDYGPDIDFVDCFTADGVWDVQMRRSNGGFRCEDGRWRFRERIAEIDDM